jgi:hypothetical protein
MRGGLLMAAGEALGQEGSSVTPGLVCRVSPLWGGFLGCDEPVFWLAVSN